MARLGPAPRSPTRRQPVAEVRACQRKGTVQTAEGLQAKHLPHATPSKHPQAWRGGPPKTGGSTESAVFLPKDSLQKACAKRGC